MAVIITHLLFLDDKQIRIFPVKLKYTINYLQLTNNKSIPT